MTQTTADNGKRRAVTVPRALAALVRQARDRRGWSGEQLAERCTAAGMPGLDRSTIANIETGRRRRIGVDEWLVLAQVLDVAPVHLLFPRAGEDEVAVSPSVTVNADRARAWAVGREPLPGTDGRTYRYEVPESEHSRRSQRLGEAEVLADKAWRRLRVARERLRLLSEERGQYDEPSLLLSPTARSQGARLDARLDTAYDEVADAKVAYEDAMDQLRRVQREEGANNGER